MDEELLLRIADGGWFAAGRWKEDSAHPNGPRAGTLYIEDEEGVDRIRDLAKLVAFIAEECAKVAEETDIEHLPEDASTVRCYEAGVAIRQAFGL